MQNKRFEIGFLWTLFIFNLQLHIFGFQRLRPHQHGIMKILFNKTYFPCAEAKVIKVNIVEVPSIIRGADWSACSQKLTQDIATIIMEGKK